MSRTVPPLHSFRTHIPVIMSTSETSRGQQVRSILSSLLFTILLSLPAVAQETATSRSGWILFNDSVAAELELRDTQLERLREIDERYREDHARLGPDPLSDPNYVALYERRNAEIATVLDAEQYRAWLRMNDLENEDTRSRPGFGPAGADMDRRDPQTPIRERDAGVNTGGAVKGGSDR